ncbi:MAG: DUF1778 domain-containing protein [Sphingomonas sp.]
MTKPAIDSNGKAMPVNLRVRTDIRTLIDTAARIQGKTRSDFMIDASRRAAEETLLDQTLLRVDQETYDHFVAVLDQPPSGPGFERIMHASKPWEQ